MKTKNALIEFAKEKGFELEFTQEPKENRLSSYWYGGVIVQIKEISTGIKSEVWANGDVRATLYDSDGDELAFVKDKKNDGVFYWEMESHITNDEQLYELISNYDEDIQPSLFVDNNNWYELFSDKWGESEIVLNSDNFLTAIEEAIAILSEN